MEANRADLASAWLDPTPVRGSTGEHWRESPRSGNAQRKRRGRKACCRWDRCGFEAAIIADYDAETAVERELVLRVASLLWRLRRLIAIETDLVRIQTEILRERRNEILPCTARIQIKRPRSQHSPNLIASLARRVSDEFVVPLFRPAIAPSGNHQAESDADMPLLSCLTNLIAH